MGSCETVPEEDLAESWRQLLLAICLTITGIYDFVIIVRDNDPDTG